jgi:hypothetical protein
MLTAVSVYAIGPIWLGCWAAFYCVPITLALAPFTAAPWPHFIALYLAMAWRSTRRCSGSTMTGRTRRG